MSKRMLRFSVVSLGLVILLLISLFALMGSSWSPALFAWRVLDLGSNSNSYVTAYSVAGWNVTEIGTTGTFANAAMGQECFKGVVFNNDLVFWRVINSTNFAITALSLSNYTFRDVFDVTSVGHSLRSGMVPPTWK